MSRYKELQAQIIALQKEAEEVRRQEIAAVVADIKARMAEYGITLQDLEAGSRRRSRARASDSHPKYRNPETGETWSGRGRKPAWLVQALSQGRSLTEFDTAAAIQ